MTEDTVICATCGKAGRADGMMHYPLGANSHAFWHTTCAEPERISEMKAERAMDALASKTASMREERSDGSLGPASAEPAEREELETNPSDDELESSYSIPRGESRMDLADAVAEAAGPNKDELLAEKDKLIAESRARISALEKDLETIESGKLAAERALRDEQRACIALARHGMLQINRDFISLANEMAMLKGEPGVHSDGTRTTEPLINPQEPFFNSQKELDEYRETMVLDFMNRYRRGAFAELEKDIDEILVVKARAYDISYKVCCELLSQRNVKLKITRNTEHEVERTAKKEERVQKAKAKIEKEETRTKSTPRSTPQDKKLEALIKLCNGNVEHAKEMLAKLDEAASEVVKKQQLAQDRSLVDKS